MSRIVDRVSMLRNNFPNLGIDGLLIAQPENIYYLSGLKGSSGYLLITPKTAIMATDFRYVEQAEIQTKDFQVTRIDGQVKDWFPGLVAGLNIARLGLESSCFTIADYQKFQTVLTHASLPVELVPIEYAVETLRTIKDENEIKFIEAAAQLTTKAMSYAVEHVINLGITEKQVAWEIEKYIREAGGELAFPTIVAGGPASAMPHAQPTDHPLQENESIVVDMGAKLDGYCADLTRTFWLGGKNDKFNKMYAIVLRAQAEAIAGIVAGLTGAEADALARDVIGETGFGAEFGHSLGHGIGLAVHELPRLSASTTTPLMDGMVFTIEPGIYIPGWGGIRIEDDAVLECGKIRLLTVFPK